MLKAQHFEYIQKKLCITIESHNPGAMHFQPFPTINLSN